MAGLVVARRQEDWERRRHHSGRWGIKLFTHVHCSVDRRHCHWPTSTALENFIPFEKFKRLNKRKYFVIPTASHKLHIFVTYKRLIWIQFDPFAHYNIISEVAHNSYNKIFPFGTPFVLLKRNKNFQWRRRRKHCVTRQQRRGSKILKFRAKSHSHSP